MSTDTIGKVREISESAVVITGGTSGIGLAAAILFAEHGCRFALALVVEAFGEAVEGPGVVGVAVEVDSVDVGCLVKVALL